MVFVSYAQNFEDVMLWRALGHIENGFYIDVGAQSPDLDSVTRAFSNAGWRGINVEPHPVYHAELDRRRPRDVNLHCALGERPGTAVIHLVGNTGLSTLDLSIATKHVDAGYAIEQAEVPIETLDHVWDSHVPPAQAVHFLKVDVEGFEPQVLRGNNWSRHRPWIVVVEATAPNSQVESFAVWEPRLLEADYEFVYKDGLNRFYVAREYAQLRESFRFPPNVFDGIVPAPLKSAREQVAQLESSLALERDQVVNLESSLASARKQVAEFESSLALERDQVAQVRSALASANSQVGELTVEQGRLRQDLVDSLSRLEALEARYAELQRLDEGVRAEIARVSEAHMRTRRKLDETNEALVAAESGMETALTAAENLRREVVELRGSNSWRLTAPLRYVGRRLPLAVRRLVGRR